MPGTQQGILTESTLLDKRALSKVYETLEKMEQSVSKCSFAKE